MVVDPSPLPDPLSTRQLRILRRLALINPGAPGLFEDACLQLASSDGLISTTLVIAHLLRELDGVLIAVLTPVSTGPSIGPDPNVRARTERTFEFLSEMGILESSPAAKELLKLVRGEGGHVKKIEAILTSLDLHEDPIGYWLAWIREGPRLGSLGTP